ncbi:MAG: hypothetical protein KatS3mg033_0159 [Thermonema sp.]|uniref:tetratricopeptide repeat protein n=1 Tax=Thermonema sp. TaxID=2231181 RepID=UPI0021DDFF43|nr:tetratricopeptide repeat protein [Thermonema sp.]GIV38359.1 MAG: hypothetical protein KatS3mg033_0159 [Thermonema sp.]
MKWRYLLPVLSFACLSLGACSGYEASDDRIYPMPEQAAVTGEKAKEVLEEAAEEAPSAYVYTKLAQWAWHNRRVPVAAAYVEEALLLDSTYAWAWYWRGHLLLQQKKAGEALLALENAHRHGYADAALWLDMGEAYRVAGDSAACMQALLEARRRMPYSASVFLALGKAYVHFGAPAEAEQALRTALAHDSRKATPYYSLLKALEMQDKKAQADSLLEVALRRVPRSDTIWYYHAQRLVSKGMIDSALVCYKKTLQLNPLHVAARYQLAEQLALRYAWEDACAHFRYLADHGQLPVRTAFYLGRCAIKEKKYEEAVEWLEKATELNPSDTQAKSYLYYARSLRDGTWVPPAQDSAAGEAESSEGLPMPAVPPPPSLEVPQPVIRTPLMKKDSLP